MRSGILSVARAFAWRRERECRAFRRLGSLTGSGAGRKATTVAKRLGSAAKQKDPI
jgi:hypothetical protein